MNKRPGLSHRLPVALSHGARLARYDQKCRSTGSDANHRCRGRHYNESHPPNVPQKVKWGESSDEVSVLGGRCWPLGKIATLDASRDQISIAFDAKTDAGRGLPEHGSVDSLRPLLRFWEAPGLIKAVPDQWISLNKEIEVKFNAHAKAQVGDYWLIPARVETGKILWHTGDEIPRGTRHHYAPLAVLSRPHGHWKVECDCRTHFTPLARFEANHGEVLRLIETQIKSAATALRAEFHQLAGRADQIHRYRSTQPIEPGDLVARSYGSRARRPRLRE